MGGCHCGSKPAFAPTIIIANSIRGGAPLPMPNIYWCICGGFEISNQTHNRAAMAPNPSHRPPPARRRT
jgi:hypothetical protein